MSVWRKDKDTLTDELTDVDGGGGDGSDADPTDPEANRPSRHRTSDLPPATPHPSVKATSATAAPAPRARVATPPPSVKATTTAPPPELRPTATGDVLDEENTKERVGNTALVRRQRGNILLADPVPPSDDVPTGMATDAQLDGFRELRTRLLAMAAALEMPHFTTLVVPLTANSGASFVARNLAAAFTLWERRASILVDCNMLHPTQHLALNTKATEGLFDFLEEPHAQLERLVHATGIPGLHLIPAGRSKSRFREYFSSPAMRSVIAALEKAECYVLLDGPPTKGSPDARILSELADFIVLVVGYGSGTADEVAAAAAMFDPTKFAGVVFNERG